MESTQNSKDAQHRAKPVEPKIEEVGFQEALETGTPDLLRNQLISSSGSAGAPGSPPSELSPKTVQHLQKQVGNKAVMRMLGKQQPKRSSESPGSTFGGLIQRTTGTRSIIDHEETIDDPGLNDLVGTVGDWMGTDPTKGLKIGATETSGNGTGDAGTGLGQDTAGGVISIVTGTVGMGMGAYNVYRSAEALQNAKAELAQHEVAYKGDDTTPGDKELYATIKLLERKKTEATKSIAENSVSILGGISGFINGVAGLASAAVVAGVAFGVGAGLNAIMGTISAFRDFFAAHKRHMSQLAIGKLQAGYIDLIEQIGDKAGTAKAEVVVIEDGIKQLNEQFAEAEQTSRNFFKRDSNVTHKQYLDALKVIRTATTKKDQLKDDLDQKQDEVKDIETEFDKYDQIRIALGTAIRKQGFGGKIGTGIGGLLSAGGGIALLAATLGAGAAAGPVGWVLSGIALVGILSYAIGMKIKRAIRDSNVERMNEEIIVVREYIDSGTINGQVPTERPPSDSKENRSNDKWFRDIFQKYGDVKKKGWFNKLTSKSKSGKMSMKERLVELINYLNKYDKGKSADIIVEGFINALKPGDEGDQMVKNPAYSDELTDEQKANTPQDVELRDLHVGLLAHFFKDKADEMKQSLLSTDVDKAKKAKELLSQKLKLG